MLFYSLLDSDILGPNVYSTASLDVYIPNARAGNAIGYRGTFNGLTLGATYSFGRDTVNAGPASAAAIVWGRMGLTARRAANGRPW